MSVESSAVLSDCGKYRYSLMRQWDGTKPHLVFCMLNPSTADAEQDDPTIRKCIKFAKRDGYGGISVINVYGIRGTDPKEALRAVDPVGPMNDLVIGSICEGRDVICAWGKNARNPHRVQRVRGILESRAASVRALGFNGDGSPVHPLYQPDTAPFVDYMGQVAVGTKGA